MFGKDSRSYANRLAKQLLKIVNVRNKIENYFEDSYQKCANLEFTEHALTAFKSVKGQPEDAATEIYHHLEMDIETMQAFLNRWEAFSNIDKKTIKLAKRLHSELVHLKDSIEDTPPEMITAVMSILEQKRLRGY